MAAAVRALGVQLTYEDKKWYGEPDLARDEFMHQAKLLKLDELTTPQASEPVSERLWRRYELRALGMLEDIRVDPAMGDALIEGSEFLRCELLGTARHEMVVKLEDFLRRRTRLSLVLPHESLASSTGLREACRILFGEAAEESGWSISRRPFITSPPSQKRRLLFHSHGRKQTPRHNRNSKTLHV